MCHCSKSPDESLEHETRRDSSLSLMISHYTVIKTMFMVLLALRMVADVTETRNVIPSLS